MKRFVTTILIFLFAVTAQAYESDTHLRVSYILARAAGIGDAVAKYLSIGNQHIDEAMITSPMLLSAQRHLYHFHGDNSDVKNADGGLISKIFKSKLALATRNHALGSLGIYHGLVKGDLQLISGGTHTKMDTFGHAGYSNLLGHAVDGHSPDRAFLEPKKYEDMMRSLLESYVAIKEVLPAEYIDNKGAVDFLNQSAEQTHLKRKITIQDMSNPVTIATALVANTELQRIFRENMYQKYEYKLLALRTIYDSFKQQGKINPGVKFEEVFPTELIRNTSYDTKKVIIATVVQNANSEFLKTMSGKDIFNLQKLFEGHPDEELVRRFDRESSQYEARLRELANMESRLETMTGLDRDRMADRIEQEALRLRSGMGLSGQMDPTSEEFYKTRANELAQIKIAEDVADHLTKDLIPRMKDEYVKHQFEEQYRTEMRDFEGRYKDDAYRRFIHKNFGVNWVLEEGTGLFNPMIEAVKKFKEIATGKRAKRAKAKEWEKLADRAAYEIIQDLEGSARDKAQVIGFNMKSKIFWIAKHFTYVARAATWVTGFYYMKKLIAEAKANAQDHTLEDMKKAVAEGRYKKNVLEETTSAYKNIQQIRAGTRFRCSYLLNGM